MTVKPVLYNLFHERHYLLGGISLRFFLFCMALFLLLAAGICLAGVFQWELGEIIDLGDIGLRGIPPYFLYYILGITGLVLMTVCCVKPLWGMYIFTIFLPFRSEDYTIINIGGAEIRIADFFIVPAILGWLLNRLYINGKGLTFDKLNLELPALLFIWWCVLSLSWSHAYSGTLSKLVQFAYGVIILFLFSDGLSKKQHFQWMLCMWMIGGILIAFPAILELASSGERAESMQTSSLETGEYLNYAILMSVSLLLITKNIWSKLAIFGAIALMVVGTLASGSRGPLLGLIAGLLFLAIYSEEYRRFFIASGITVLASSVMAITILVIAEVRGIDDIVRAPFERFINLFERSSVHDVGELYRFYIWYGIWRIYLQHPILGIGLGSLPEMLPDYVPRVFQKPALAHNMYFEIFIAVGPIGFVLFLWLIYRLMLVCRDLLHRPDPSYRTIALGVVSAIIAQAVGGLTFGLFFENRVLWSAFGILFALRLASPKLLSSGEKQLSG